MKGKRDSKNHWVCPICRTACYSGRGRRRHERIGNCEECFDKKYVNNSRSLAFTYSPEKTRRRIFPEKERYLRLYRFIAEGNERQALNTEHDSYGL